MTMSRTVRRHRGWIAAGTLVVVAIVAYAMFRQSGTEVATTSYETEAAALGTISVTVSGTGNLEIDGTTAVYPVSAGTVEDVMVAEGEKVATGTVLFTLDANDADANTSRAYASYIQAQQGLSSAEGQVLKAENSLSTLKDRYEEQEDEPSTPATGTVQTTSTEVTQDDIDLAEHDVATAEKGLASSKASLSSASLAYSQAQIAERDLEVHSPVSGFVWSLDVESGDAVSANGGGSVAGATTVATTNSSSAPIVIAPEQPLALHLTVNEVDVPAIEVGQRAEIEFDALPDLTATGKVYEITNEGTNTQGVVTFDVWLSVDVLDARLRSGMSSAASIVTAFERDSLLVPNAAVKTDSDGGYYLEVMSVGATEPQRVSVETGLTSATQTQVISGLSEGDLVVTQIESDGTQEDAGTGGGLMIPGMGGGGGPRE